VVAGCSVNGEPAPTPAEPVTTSSSPTTSISTTSIPDASSTTTTTSTTLPLPELTGLGYEIVADGLAFPMIIMPWTAELSLVGLRDGRVHSFDGRQISAEPLFDIEVSTSGERGLLGLEAGGPDVVFVHYSDPAGDTVVSEIRVSDGTERVLLRVSQPASNHNGGMLQTGPDGMLYVGLGDGGGSNDRFGHGQNTDTLLGGIVRIDPQSGETDLWSYGLRNPFRFWWDDEVLYIGDVGQNAFEEVDVVEYRSEGYNFGWPITEGLHCFSPRTGCDTTGLTLPVLEVAHGDGGACSITGGVVYRGGEIPELEGHYLYSDYCGGWLRSFLFDGGEATAQRDWTAEVGSLRSVVSFGVDHHGEVYVLTPDAIRRIVPVR
jgi:glucose/arabinose dehydrogenase